MKESKLVSVRIDGELLESIDLIVGGNRYYNRSSYIQAGLQLMVELNKRGLDRDAIHFCPRVGDVVDEISFKYHRERKCFK